MKRKKTYTPESADNNSKSALSGNHNVISDFLYQNFTSGDVSNGLSATKRIRFIDLAKGLCILLVVYDHSNMSEYFDIPALRTLRMPLYFLLSGLFFKDYGSFFNLLEKKLNKLIVPFVFFSLIALPLVYMDFHTITINDLLNPIINRRGGYNIPVWFLLSLFWVNLFFGAISLFVRKTSMQCFCVISLSIFGVILALHNKHLPCFMTQALTAMPFFYAGYIMKKTSLLYENIRHDRLLLLIAASVLIFCIAIFPALGSPKYAFYSLEYDGNVLVMYLFSLIVVTCTLLVCKSIGWLPVVSYIGRFSIVVLGLHWLYLKAFSISYRELVSPEVNIPLSLAVALVASWFSIPIVIKYFPGLAAQKDIISFQRSRKVKLS